MKLFIAKLLILLGIINQPIQTPTLPKTPQITPNLPENSTPIATTTPNAGLEALAEATTTTELGGEESYIPECQCVYHSRQTSDFNNFKQVKYAYEIPITSSIPKVGAVVVFSAGEKYGKFGHSATLLTKISDTKFLITEKNAPGHPCEVTTREIDISKEPIKGYYAL